MIDIKLLREQPGALKASLERRGLGLDVDRMAEAVDPRLYRQRAGEASAI